MDGRTFVLSIDGKHVWPVAQPRGGSNRPPETVYLK